MQSIRKLRNSTFVLTLALTLLGVISSSAAPHSEAPSARTESEDDTPVVPKNIEDLSVTPVPMTASPKTDIDSFVARYNRENYYFPYRQELIAHAGVVIGLRDSSSSSRLINPIVGFDYILPREFSPKYESGADLSVFTGRGHLWFMRRHIANEKGAFRPFYSYGIMHNFVPDERLASFSNYSNYLLRTAVGLENIMRPPKSAIVDLSLAVGQKDILVLFTYGASWAF
jgi:hypothetical protein